MNENPRQHLTRQHRHIDAAIKQMLAGDSDVATLHEALTMLRVHIRLEEEVLFDPIAAIGLEMPIYIMQVEHAQMWTLMDTLQSACSDDPDATSAWRNPCRKLLRLLDMHNPKEEDLIYAAADRLAAEGVLDTGAVFDQSSALPEGWVCRGRRDGFAPPPGAPPWPPGGRVV